MSPGLEEKLERAAGGKDPELDREDLEEALSGDSGIDAMLFLAADSTLRRTCGPEVYLRGLVEFSNLCSRNCLYCGLRSGNTFLPRYTMSLEEITAVLDEGWEAGLRSFLLQSGELRGFPHTALASLVLEWAERRWGDEVRMVLSMGEYPRASLEELRKAGGDRYLLRIESSDPELFARLHLDGPSPGFQARLQCLLDLKATGWQTGSGVLIGVPGQTTAHLAGDLLFLRDLQVDMCGMGPWIEHPGTPLYEQRGLAPSREERVALTLRMTALLRILMPDINIAATTALQTLQACGGLEAGLRAGANVVMPSLTPARYRELYDLYEGRAAVPDRLHDTLAHLADQCAAIGRRLVPGVAGDPVHFSRRSAASRPAPAGGAG